MKTVRVVAAVIKAVNEKSEPILFAPQRGWPVPERRNGAAGGWAFPRRWQRRPGRRGWCGARGEASGCSLP